jgi:hypothetical protein
LARLTRTSQHLIEDIGLRREDLGHEVDKPFGTRGSIEGHAVSPGG